jgi:hypothetical protein
LTAGAEAARGATKILAAIIYQQGQEGQGRPADLFIRRFKSGQGNPYRFENNEGTQGAHPIGG